MLCAVRVPEEEEEEDVEWHLLYLQSVCLSVGLTQEVKFTLQVSYANKSLGSPL